MTDSIERVRVLHDHTSAETAYLVEDYPYGYTLRCQIRYWVDTAAKGAKRGQQRFMSQTTNPKQPGEVWNKPKGSTYSRMVVLYLDGREHVKSFHISEYGLTAVGDARFRLLGLYDQITDDQRATYDQWVIESKSYADPWERFELAVTAMTAQIRATGADPTIDNSIYVVGDRRIYISEHEAPVYLAAARQRLAAPGTAE